MERTFNVYKGLQRPLVYRGFSGKFIYWALASVLCGLVLGALTIALFSMLFGVLVLAACIAGGMYYTLSEQKRGLHQKSRSKGIIHHQSQINPKVYVKAQRISDALYRY